MTIYFHLGISLKKFSELFGEVLCIYLSSKDYEISKIWKLLFSESSKYKMMLSMGSSDFKIW
jgi:hypothetical protein